VVVAGSDFECNQTNNYFVGNGGDKTSKVSHSWQKQISQPGNAKLVANLKSTLKQKTAPLVAIIACAYISKLWC